MTMLRPAYTRSQRSQVAGFSLVEAVFAILIVGLMLAAAMQTVGASRLSQFKTSNRAMGQRLAAEMMNEILSKAYNQPHGTSVFGPESSEITGTRARFDDVDDYAGWSSSPPTTHDGQVIPGYQGWTRSVSVVWADPTDLARSVASDQGIKRITVTVKDGNLPVATLTSLCTSSFSDNLPTPGLVLDNSPPQAVAKLDTSSPTAGRSLAFDASQSTDPDGDALAYTWVFDDGVVLTGANVSHAFATAGTHSATLTVTDTHGQSDSDALTFVLE